MAGWAIWLIIAGVLIIFEIVTLTFYLLWLGIGAAVAGLIALIAPDSFVLQALVGGATALVLTIFTKPLTRKVRHSKGFKDAIDDMVGKPGVLLEDLVQGRPGIVKVGSQTWSAIAQQSLHKNDKVKVVRRGTAVLEVEKWEDE